ncbi:MAG: sigma 54-interacting transcriptional regulator [Syntrophomonadaceae bacterium]|jgi:transcriptional regulator with PAS, ATPase and Fis domain
MNHSNVIVVMTDQAGVIQEIHGRNNITGLECGTPIADEWLPLNGHQEGWAYIGNNAYRYQRFDLSHHSGSLYVLHLHPDKTNQDSWTINSYQPKKPYGHAITGKIIGSSPIISELRNTLLEIAASPSSVLITGESGTGKELFAQAIHYCSKRAKGPFIKLNCAAIPESLLESELFGYVEGAFTGARRGGRTGKFELANEGTIFLDEIGDMPLTMQAKLLRVVQEKEIERIGDDRPTAIDVRIISATNKDLSALISQNRFRLDLYYRLNVVNLHIPALRERKEDIPLLTSHFIQELNRKLGRQIRDVDEAAMSLLMQYHWPGNVRELINVLEKTMNFCHSPVLRPEHLATYLRQQTSVPYETSKLSLKTGLLATEYEQIRAALKASRGKRQQAAKILGVSRTTLYRLMKKHQMI